MCACQFSQAGCFWTITNKIDVNRVLHPQEDQEDQDQQGLGARVLLLLRRDLLDQLQPLSLTS
jgi:hypothetical protein